MKKIITTILTLFIAYSAYSQLIWYSPLNKKENYISGRGWYTELKNGYNRLPDRVKDKLRTKHWDLSQNSAGLTIKFNTNASRIVVKYCVGGEYSMPHMPATGVSGVDLYAYQNRDQVWCRGAWNFSKDTITYTYNNLDITKDGEATFELYLPLYTTVKHLEIGTDRENSFSFIPVRDESPIVCYGTSITQGACASRPGMAWTNILHRKLDYPIINLGFSGQGQLDMPMFRMLSELDAALYIIDCMPNMTRHLEEHIYQRFIDGVKEIRKHSSSPILIVEHCGYMNDLSSSEALNAYKGANKELLKAYKELKKEGIKNLHYMTKEELGLTPDSQVDGVHPTDLGMQEYANAYYKAVKKIVKFAR